MSLTSQMTVSLPPAFRLVRQILSQRPLHFQDLLKEGLARHSTETSDPSSSSTSTVLSTRRGAPPGKGKKGEKAVAKVPEGHPFVSANFLKRRVLPVLESQQLIYLKHVPSDTASKSNSPFQWHLSLPMHPTSKWDPDAHWERLLSGEHPGQVAGELNLVRAEKEKAAKEEFYASGREKRPEREVWAWEGREPELTTRLERLHLNKRRQGNRPAKERKEMRLRQRMEERQREAMQIAERIIKEEDATEQGQQEQGNTGPLA